MDDLSKGVDVTFNADGWPARKIAMFAVVFGMPPMDVTGSHIRRLIPWTTFRMWAFYKWNNFICKHWGHVYSTDAAREYDLCDRCVQFQSDPDTIPLNIPGKKK
jgi:hypothetical protein